MWLELPGYCVLTVLVNGRLYLFCVCEKISVALVLLPGLNLVSHTPCRVPVVSWFHPAHSGKHCDNTCILSSDFRMHFYTMMLCDSFELLTALVNKLRSADRLVKCFHIMNFRLSRALRKLAKALCSCRQLLYVLTSIFCLQ
jgi:hypothetical protein